MKKLVAISLLAAMLLAAISVSAMASATNWKMYFQASNAAGTAGGGSQLTVGTATAASNTAGSFLSTGVANAMVYNSALGGTPPLYTADMRTAITQASPQRSWDIYVWRMQGMPGTDMKVAWTVGTISGPSNQLPPQIFWGTQAYAYKIEVVKDPTGQHSDFVWTSPGWTANPSPNLGTGASLSWTNLGNKADTTAPYYLQGDQTEATTVGVQMRLTVAPVAPVPEPSSMLALASGLFGMAGFAIRRRK